MIVVDELFVRGPYQPPRGIVIGPELPQTLIGGLGHKGHEGHEGHEGHKGHQVHEGHGQGHEGYEGHEGHGGIEGQELPRKLQGDQGDVRPLRFTPVSLFSNINPPAVGRRRIR